MRTADNDNTSSFGSSKTALSSESSVHESGLSSAMHDIRLLATTYQEHHNQGDGANTPATYHAAPVDPRVLLIPTREAPTERWKLLMLGMMILIGLSTSAIAVSMIMEESPASLSESSKRIEARPGPTLVSPSVEVPTAAVPSTSAPETASTEYQLTRSPESSRANPQTHESAVPPTKTRKTTRSSVRKKTSRDASAALATSSCDEVACLIGVDGACCGTLPSEDNAQDAEDELAARPYRLSRSQVMTPMQSVNGRVGTCANNHDYQGVALVKIVITPEGAVDSFDLDDGSAAFQSCVQKQVETLRFAKLSQPFTVSYPYSLR